MIFGFSNGGGIAFFANWAYGDVVTRESCIDFYPYNDIDAWLPHYHSLNNADGFAAKIYFNCDSWLFSDQGIDQVISGAGLSPTSSYSEKLYGGWGYGQEGYMEWTYTGTGGKFLTYAVHGLNPSNNLCDSQYQTMCYGCTGEMAHITVPHFVDLVGDVYGWLGYDLSSGGILPS